MKKQKEQDAELKNLCFNISYLRFKHGLTKQEMSKILGVPLRTLNFIEDKYIVPESIDVEVLFRMYDYFGYKLPLFFDFICGDYTKVDN